MSRITEYTRQSEAAAMPATRPLFGPSDFTSASTPMCEPMRTP